jgi:hypothetical protein
MGRLHFKIEADVDPALAFLPDRALEMTLDSLSHRLTRTIINKLKESTDTAQVDISLSFRPSDADALTEPIQHTRFAATLVEE